MAAIAVVLAIVLGLAVAAAFSIRSGPTSPLR
jgi:hypothetical protein